MGVVVTSAATSHDLTTYGLVALELGLSDGDTSLQHKIGPLIPEVSSSISRFCGREFARQTYTETVAGHGSDTLLLTHGPVVSITSVSLNGTAITGSDYALVGNAIYRLSGGLFGPTWAYTYGYPTYTVVYVAGYILPGNSGETLPPALRRIATKAVAHEHLNAGRDGTITSEKMGDLSVTYGGDGSGLPAHICKALTVGGFRRSMVFA
jgi:hypothetical protein